MSVEGTLRYQRWSKKKHSLSGHQQALSGPTVDLRLGESARKPSPLHGPSSFARFASAAPIIT